ncbi:MAG: ROK family protein, partial [Verrucomicrobiae bacterium]|nr:ROK family protein [Verrucomicrobiae bacterium]
MNPNQRAIGIDIGGTKTAVGAVDGAGALAARATFATEAGRGFPRFVERATTAINQVLNEAGWSRANLCGIGIGCPGPVDPKRGLINNPYTLEGWDRCDIVTPLRERFGVPVCLENDADSAVTGEAFVGAARGCDRVVLLT